MTWNEFTILAFPQEQAEKERNRGVVWKVARVLGLRLGYVFLRLGISANTVSLMAVLVVCVSLYCFSSVAERSWLAPVGTILAYLAVFLDFCDGPVARASRRSNKLGQLLDDIPPDMLRGGLIIVLGISTQSDLLAVLSIGTAYIIVPARNLFINGGFIVAYPGKWAAAAERLVFSVPTMTGLLPIIICIHLAMAQPFSELATAIVVLYSLLCTVWLSCVLLLCKYTRA